MKVALVHEIVDHWAREQPDAVALRDNRGAYTYAELAAAGRCAARSLRGRGIVEGQLVATGLEADATWIALLLGALRAGVVIAPLSDRWTSEEMSTYLARLKPDVVVAQESWGVLRSAVVDGAPVDFVPSEGHRDLNARVREVLGADPSGPDDPADGASRSAIAFPTGGTTGVPKSAIWSAGGLALAVQSSITNLEVRRADTELYVSPIFHVTIVPGVLATLCAGARTYMVPGGDVAHIAAMLVGGEVTRMFATPTLYRRVMRECAAPCEAEMRLIYGAARSGSAFLTEMIETFPRARLFSGYGSTETGAVARLFHENITAPVDRGVGRPVAGVRIRAVGPDGEDLPAGEIGELAVWSPWRMMTYRGQAPEGASELPDGGLRTGDLGYLDPDGYLHLTGRLKEMIKSGGENIYPAEVEEVLTAHPGVHDAAVYGVPDDEWGEQVQAAVVLRKGINISPDDLRRHCRAKLAGYKVPKRFEIMDELPVTGSMKVDRSALVARTKQCVGRHDA